MSKHAILRAVFVLCCLTVLWGGVSVAFAAGESFQVISVDTTGCNSGEFGMTVDPENLDGGVYTIHTIVTVGGLVYMNENALISVNGLRSWFIFNLFNYGAVPNPGTYPIPSGQQMRLDFTVERPIGTVLYSWQLEVDGCDTGNVLYNGLPRTAGCSLSIPDNSVVGEAPLGAQAFYAPGQVASGVVLNPGTYIVTGQDESQTYYQVALACQLLWVRKDTMQPSYEAPQNGAPLPTQIVG